MAKWRPELSSGLDLSDIETNKVALDDGITAPAAVSGQAILYVDAADGNLKIIFGDGRILPLQNSATDNITSGTTQTQAGATALTAKYNRVTTHTNNDGVKLPTAVAGLGIRIHNDTVTNNIQVWPNTSDAIEAASVDAVGVQKIAAGVITTYHAVDATTWYITDRHLAPV